MSSETLTLSTNDVQRLEPILSRAHLGDGAPFPTHLRSLTDKLVWCLETDPARVPGDVVTMNSRVRLHDLEDASDREYELVFPRDAEPAEGRVSVLAPLGAALIGARVGGVIDVSTPNRVRRLRVTALLFQPEAAGRFDL